MSAPEAKVIRDGVVKQIPSREVTIGDRVLLEAGDCVPADGKLIECASLKVDESALTGESLSVEKSLDEVPEGAALGLEIRRTGYSPEALLLTAVRHMRLRRSVWEQKWARLPVF